MYAVKVFHLVYRGDEGDYRVRKTVESYHTVISNEADKNSKPLPRQYSVLLK